jgi:adenine-specific DNA-methyltransferase
MSPAPLRERLLTDPATWRSELGLLPVPLYGRDRELAHVLLNGARGNLVLDLRDNIDSATGRSEAWSSNLHYRVAIRGHEVLVQRWDRLVQDAEVFRADQVLQRFERFHRHLELQAPPAALSVVSHSLRIFRSLRAALGEEHSGEGALKAFLVLLAAATQDTERGALNLERWGLSEDARDIAQVVRPGEWEALVQEMVFGRPVERLSTHMPLVLRHAAGQLFQEAHYAAAFEPFRQMSLGLTAPDPASIVRTTDAIGLHFTPSALARTLVEEALAAIGDDLPDHISVFDPACGSGEFLREFVRQLDLRRYTGRVQLIGWDLSPAACAMTRFALACENAPAEFEIMVDVVCQDALNIDVNWPDNVDVVLMNPPFQSWRDMTGAMQARVTEILGRDVKGARPDLAMAFLKSASLALGPSGTLGTVLPASILDGTSAEALRGALSEQLHPALLARLGSHELFHGARVDAALYVASRVLRDDPPIAFWADHRATSSSAALRALRRARSVAAPLAFPVVQEGFSLYPNPELGVSRDSWAPRPYEQWRLLRAAEGAARVGEVFDVRQGVITGLNKIFVLGPEAYTTLPESEQRYFRPAVLNHSFVAGRLVSVGYVFYPYGPNALETEELVREHAPVYFTEQLLPNKEKLLQRKRISEDNWWLLSEYRAWQIATRPKLVTAYFGDIGSFAWDETGEHVVIQGYAWLPRGKSILSRAAWLAHLALLNSSLTSSLLAATSNNVGGGQWNLSKRFMAKMPWIRVHDRKFPASLLSELATIGEQIHLGSFAWNEQHAQRELRELAAAALGIE